MSTKKNVPPEMLEMARRALLSYGYDHVLDGDDVTLKLADVARLIAGLMSEHNKVHAIQGALRSIFPVIGLYENVDKACDEFHADFPVNDHMRSLVDEGAVCDLGALVGIQTQERVSRTLLSRAERPRGCGTGPRVLPPASVHARQTSQRGPQLK